MRGAHLLTFTLVRSQVLINLTANTGAEQMQLVDAAMTSKYGKSLGEAIKDAMGGDVEDAMKVRSTNKYEYFAEALNKAWSGFGTDECATSRIMGRYSKTELGKISQHYQAKFGKTVQEGVESETSGNYKKSLLAYLYSDMPGYQQVQGCVTPELHPNQQVWQGTQMGA